jgi:hypothetical protein
MTEGFRSPPQSPTGPGYIGAAAARQDAVDTVQRIMGEDIAPAQRPATPPAAVQGGPSADGADTSTTEVAKQQAADVADTAKQAGAQVADTVKEQAGQVTAEATHQAKQLLAQAQSELSEQAAATQQRVSEGLHALADELSGMARNSDQDGVATDLARQAADKARQTAGWLADRDPGSLLDEVRSFARRKPGTYLAIALGAGVLAGRLTRGLTAPAEDTTPTQAPSIPAATPPGQVGAGQHPITGGMPSGATGFDPDPVTGPVLPAPPPFTDPAVPASAPGAGIGDTAALGGQRGVVAP